MVGSSGTGMLVTKSAGSELHYLLKNLGEIMVSCFTSMVRTDVRSIEGLLKNEALVDSS